MDLERIEAILKLLQRQDHVGTLSVEGADWRVRARRGAVLPVVPLGEPPVGAEGEIQPERQVVRALAVGVYRSGKGSARVGDYVEAGKALGDIDSMGVLNPVTADFSGFVTETLVEDGDPVEYGQELFVVGAEDPSQASAR